MNRNDQVKHVCVCAFLGGPHFSNSHTQSAVNLREIREEVAVY